MRDESPAAAGRSAKYARRVGVQPGPRRGSREGAAGEESGEAVLRGQVVALDVLAKLLAGAREDLRDAGLADAEACADLGTLQLLDVHEAENRLLALGEVADRLAHDRRALRCERDALGLVLAHRRLDRVADLEIGLVRRAGGRVQRPDL